MIIKDQFGTIQNLQRAKPVTGQELFFAVSYSKPALEVWFDYVYYFDLLTDCAPRYKQCIIKFNQSFCWIS